MSGRTFVQRGGCCLVPGILAASVHREPEQPNVVHDIRIFANHAASQAQ